MSKERRLWIEGAVAWAFAVAVMVFEVHLIQRDSFIFAGIVFGMLIITTYEYGKWMQRRISRTP